MHEARNKFVNLLHLCLSNTLKTHETIEKNVVCLWCHDVRLDGLVTVVYYLYNYGE